MIKYVMKVIHNNPEIGFFIAVLALLWGFSANIRLDAIDKILNKLK